MRIGYACINLSLADQKVQVNRSMMKRTFLEKGIAYASTLALANFKDLEKVIDWNIANKVGLYRMSSEMVPWMSEYEIADLPDFPAIARTLGRIGKKVKEHDLRLTFHPGPFNILASNNERVIANTIKELRQHGEIMDMLGLPRTPFAKINIHVGAAYGDKRSALERFAGNYADLPPTARDRLTIENDDKLNMFSVRDLLWLHDRTGIPIVFDHFHHTFCTGGLSEEEALKSALGTWPERIVPIVHYSSSRKLHEDATAGATSHADHIHGPIELYGQHVDVMLEAKAKDLAVIAFRKMNDPLKSMA